jgi:hypothetical protein
MKNINEDGEIGSLKNILDKNGKQVVNRSQLQTKKVILQELEKQDIQSA